MSVQKLSQMPNIGKVLEDRLMGVGIASGEELRSVGSREAFSRLRSADGSTCLNTFYALEGAIRDTRWHHLSEITKLELKQFYAAQAIRGESCAKG